MNKLNLIFVNTNYYADSDCWYLITDLTLKQAKDIINPIVQIERRAEIKADENDEDIDPKAVYTNEMLLKALKTAYPDNIIMDKDYLTFHKKINFDNYNPEQTLEIS